MAGPTTFDSPLPINCNMTTGPREGNADDICPLCRLTPIRAQEPSVAHTDCGHRFHTECFGEMVKYTSPIDLACPICRRALAIPWIVGVEDCSEAENDGRDSGDRSYHGSDLDVEAEYDLVSENSGDVATIGVVSLEDDDEFELADDEFVESMSDSTTSDEGFEDSDHSDEDSTVLVDTPDSTVGVIMVDVTTLEHSEPEIPADVIVANVSTLDHDMSEVPHNSIMGDYISPEEGQSGDEEDAEDDEAGYGGLIWHDHPLHPMHERYDRDFL